MRRKGFTLVELIVGLGLVSIFSLVAMSFLVSQLRVNTTQTKISEAQASMQATMNLIRWDIMMAGFGTNVAIIPHSVGDLNPSVPNPDELEVVTYFSPVGGNGHWSYVLEDVSYTNEVLVKNWENNVYSNIASGDSIILFSVNKTKVGECRVVSTQVISSEQLKLTLSSNISASKGTLVFALPLDGRVHIRYQLVDGTLMRNGISLQQNIEDFKVLYWIDSNNDGRDNPSEWKTDFTQEEVPYLKLVKVSVVKLVGPDPGYDELGKNYNIQGDSYNVSSQTRHFRRRIYSFTVKPRNLGV